MRITIVGGGNIGTQFAVHCAEKGMMLLFILQRLIYMTVISISLM